MIRVGSAIINDNKILLAQHSKKGEKYYVLPGGHVENNETPEIAAIREVKEECNLDVKIIKKLAKGIFKKQNQVEFFFLCEFLGGQLSNMHDPDKKYERITSLDWVDISKFGDYDARPKEFFLWFIKNSKNIENIKEIKDLGEY